MFDYAIVAKTQFTYCSIDFARLLFGLFMV